MIKILIALLISVSANAQTGWYISGGNLFYNDGAGNIKQVGFTAGTFQVIPTAGQGLGGTVTQTGNKGTAVTLNKQYGQITMVNSALAAAAEISFTLNNNTISSTDLVLVNIQSVGTAGSYFVTVGAVANGSCSITIGNASTGSLSQALVLNFCVVKSVSN